ncbi:MAG: hypothetical protein Q8O67_34365 [Deltaproteobacteria bacterium]|nr:hypothetical protein [Deltaproteobacteria bacterium]
MITDRILLVAHFGGAPGGSLHIEVVRTGDEWHGSTRSVRATAYYDPPDERLKAHAQPDGGWPALLHELDRLGIDDPPADVNVEVDDGPFFELTVECLEHQQRRSYGSPDCSDEPEAQRAWRILLTIQDAFMNADGD